MSIYFLFIPVILLIVFPIILLLGWNQLPSHPPHGSGKFSFAILIPFRNEENRIIDLLSSLTRLNFPRDRYSVYFLDDHSEDGSAILIKSFIGEYDNAYYIPATGQGKKAALEEGTRLCNEDIILTTDADCILPRHWITSYENLYSRHEVQMIPGMVRIMPQNMWSTWQSIELASLIGTAGGSIGLGIPSICNGANLSFRKKAFLEVGGYMGNDHLASGDDEFLLHKIEDRYSNGILYNKDPLGVVTTSATDDLQQYQSQRKRWASKWKHHTKPRMKWTGPVLVACYLTLLACWGWMIFDSNAVLLLALLTLAKLSADMCLILFVLKECQIFISPIKIFLAGIIYPFYFLYFAFVVQGRQYEWKGRRYSTAYPK